MTSKFQRINVTNGGVQLKYLIVLHNIADLNVILLKLLYRLIYLITVLIFLIAGGGWVKR
jgi:hypothetical protein